MSWGIKIIFLYSGFVALILTMVGLTMREKVDLVSEDYYQQELDYQERINTIERPQRLEEPLTWEATPENLVLRLPERFSGGPVTGSVFFFRPSDKRLDKTLAIPSGTQRERNIPLTELKSGLYKMQISWKAGGTEYYNEGVIQIP
jgi:hypothetical protein